MRWQTKSVLLKAFIHSSALSFLGYYYYLAIIDQLGGDPVEAIIHFTGIGALNLLFITLMVSPMAKYFKMSWLMKSRRLLGLYAFVYALCHVINFWAFEIQGQLSLFLSEVIKRPYITVGLTAFIILLLLAITSFSRLQRKMGKRWQQLHNWVYLAILLASIHFFWSVKSEIIEPSIYLIVCLFLLSLRKQKVQKWLSRSKKH